MFLAAAFSDADVLTLPSLAGVAVLFVLGPFGAAVTCFGAGGGDPPFGT